MRRLRLASMFVPLVAALIGESAPIAAVGLVAYARPGEATR